MDLALNGQGQAKPSPSTDNSNEVHECEVAAHRGGGKGVASDRRRAELVVFIGVLRGYAQQVADT